MSLASAVALHGTLMPPGTGTACAARAEPRPMAAASVPAAMILAEAFANFRCIYFASPVDEIKAHAAEPRGSTDLDGCVLPAGFRRVLCPAGSVRRYWGAAGRDSVGAAGDRVQRL